MYDLYDLEQQVSLVPEIQTESGSFLRTLFLDIVIKIEKTQPNASIGVCFIAFKHESIYCVTDIFMYVLCTYLVAIRSGMQYLRMSHKNVEQMGTV